jgi:copper transport protein
VALALLALSAPPALAHSAFLGSSPQPGARLGEAPRQVTLSFTEALNERLSRAKLVFASDGRLVRGAVSVASGTRLVVRRGPPLRRGAYRVEWHTVSAEDGHALEGSFSFGVRAPAAGGEHDVQQSPLARQGWVRMLARGSLFSTLLVFCGVLLLTAVLGRGRASWFAPPALVSAAPQLDFERVERRGRRFTLALGFLAAGAAALSAVADGVDAAGGLSARGLSDFLFSGTAGLTRVYVVLLLLLAVALAGLRLRPAPLAAVGALMAVAFSGHANAASPRLLAVANDWAHLTGTALWLGGIAFIISLWGPELRRSSQAERLAVARHVLPAFGRVALPAFAVVVATGLVSAIIELGRLQALWETDYGRVLIVKVVLVALIAAASYVHALRLRPRLLRANPHPNLRLERRHWRLLGVEPLLGVAVVAAVAVLVAFPLPPRQLGDAGEAEAAAAPACDPCPLPRPAKGELAVAEQGGSNVVAVWMRRRRGVLTGTVRLYGLSDRPARHPFRVLGARQRSCGGGCARFVLAPAEPVLRVAVRQAGHRFVARLSTGWRAGQQWRARTVLGRAQATMRRLTSVRESERVSSVPGRYARTEYRLAAPDRMAYRTNGQVESVVVGATQWTRGQPDADWQKGQFGGGLPFRTRSWFSWTRYARSVYLLDVRRQAGRRVAIVGLMDSGTPAWWRVYIDLATDRVLRDRLVTYGHFMTQRFYAFNRPAGIEPPQRPRRGR